MKSTKAPQKIQDVSKHGEKGKIHASWPNSKVGVSSTAKIQPKIPNK